MALLLRWFNRFRWFRWRFFEWFVVFADFVDDFQLGPELLVAAEAHVILTLEGKLHLVRSQEDL